MVDPFSFAYPLMILGSVIVAGRRVIARRSRPQRRLDESMPFSIAELPPHALGRLIGAVETAGATVEAPLTGSPCVYWSVRVFRDNRMIVDDRGGVPFTLADDSGRATIDPREAASDLAPEHFTNAIAVDPDARQAAFLAKHRLAGASFPFRFEEAIVADGLVAAVGYATRGRDGRLHMKPFAIGNDSSSLGIAVPAAHARIRGTPGVGDGS